MTTTLRSSLTYRDLAAWTAEKLREMSWDNALIDHGPPSDDRLVLSPNAIAFLTVGGGAGLDIETAYDRPFISTYVVGPQDEYDTAEALAIAIDTIYCRVTVPTLIGAARVTNIQRSGGRPTLFQQDTANRYHFTCSYIVSSTSGL